MKYLKFLIIPMITLMFIVPVKADTIELPDDPRVDDPNYEYIIIKSTYLTDTSYQLYIASKGFNFTWTDNVVRIYTTTKNWNLYWSSGDVSWRELNPRTLEQNFNKPEYSGVELLYSSKDIYNSSGDLVFHKTPVADLAKLQKKSLENLGTEVQGASWRISAVGGVILGAVLVSHLVTRLRRWATV